MMDDIKKDIVEVYRKMGGDMDTIPGKETIGILQVSIIILKLFYFNYKIIGSWNKHQWVNENDKHHRSGRRCCEREEWEIREKDVEGGARPKSPQVRRAEERERKNRLTELRKGSEVDATENEQSIQEDWKGSRNVP